MALNVFRGSKEYSVHVQMYVHLLGIKTSVSRAVSKAKIIHFSLFIHVFQTDTRKPDVVYLVDVSF